MTAAPVRGASAAVQPVRIHLRVHVNAARPALILLLLLGGAGLKTPIPGVRVGKKTAIGLVIGAKQTAALKIPPDIGSPRFVASNPEAFRSPHGRRPCRKQRGSNNKRHGSSKERAGEFHLAETGKTA